jgi:hypothetical protein
MEEWEGMGYSMGLAATSDTDRESERRSIESTFKVFRGGIDSIISRRVLSRLESSLFRLLQPRF